MTREEAIADIRDNIKPVVGGKSLDMAIKALEQQPCEDCISRAEALHILECNKHVYVEDIEELPSVTPKPIIGQWIKTPKAVMGEGYMWYCDKCEYQVYQDSSRPYPSEKYCPNCGARMVEPIGK